MKALIEGAASKKFIATVLGAALIALGDKFKIPPEAVESLAQLLSVYLGGQSLVDTVKAHRVAKQVESEAK